MADYDGYFSKPLLKRRSTGSMDIRTQYIDYHPPTSPPPFSASTDRIHIIDEQQRAPRIPDYDRTFLDLAADYDDQAPSHGDADTNSIYDDAEYEDMLEERSQAQMLADEYMEELEDFCRWSGTSEDFEQRKSGTEPVQDMIRAIDRALTMSSLGSRDEDDSDDERMRDGAFHPLRHSTRTRRASAFVPTDPQVPMLRRQFSRRTSSFGNPAQDPSLQDDEDDPRRPSVAESLQSIKIALVRTGSDARRLQARRFADAPDSMVFPPPRRINPRGPIHSSFPDSPTDPWKALPPLPPEAYQKDIEPPQESPLSTHSNHSSHSNQSAPLSICSDVGLSDGSSWTESLSEPHEYHSPEKEVAPIEERISFHEDMGKEVVPDEDPVISCRIESVATLDFPEFMPTEDSDEEEETRERGSWRVSDGEYYLPDRHGRSSPTSIPGYPAQAEHHTQRIPRDALGISREVMQQKWSETPSVNMVLPRSRPGTPDTGSSRSSSPDTSASRPRPLENISSGSWRRKAAENFAGQRISPKISPPLGSSGRSISPPVYKKSWGMI